MMYKIICSESLRFTRTILIYFLIISYLTTFSSCMTTESLTVSPDSLKPGSSVEITKIKLKNGDSIDCENKVIQVIKRSDSIVALSIYNKISREGSETFRKNQVIQLNDILTFQLEKSETNIPLTILFVSGILIGFFGLIALLIINSSGTIWR